MSPHQPDSPLAFLRTFIAVRRQALEQLETALVHTEQVFGANHGAAPAAVKLLTPPKRRVKRTRVIRRTRRRASTPPTSGALPDRIVEILTAAGTPLKLAALVTKSGAKEYHVRLTLNALAAEGRVVPVGASRARRYGTPQTAKREHVADDREGD